MSNPQPPYLADDALRTWDSVKDTPPRDPPHMNGHGGHGGAAPAYGENDSENGRRLLDNCGADLLYVKTRKHPWHVWDGNCWLPDRTQWVEGRMEAVLRAALGAAAGNNYVPRNQLQGQTRWLNESLDMKRIRPAIMAASFSRTVENSVFDQNDWLLPCNNGATYDLRDGTLRESSRDDLMSRCVPVAASREPVPCEVWHAVLRLVMDDDLEMVNYLRRVFWLMLTGDVSEKCFWFFVGKTNAGKTTMLTFLARLLGEFAYKIPLRGLLKRYGDPGIRHDLAGLQGMRFTYAEEFKPGDVLDVGVMKEIAGDSDITADRKGEANETFKCRAKLVLGTNDMPLITDIDDAIRGRVRVVPFPVNVPQRLAELALPVQSVDDVVAALLAEAPGILQDLMAAGAEWRAAGGKLGMPTKVYEATKQYLDEQDPLLEWIATSCLPPTAEGERKVNEQPFAILYWSFIEQSDRDPKRATKSWFARQLERHKFVKRATYLGKLYTGPELTYAAFEAADRRWRKEEKGYDAG